MGVWPGQGALPAALRILRRVRHDPARPLGDTARSDLQGEFFRMDGLPAQPAPVQPCPSHRRRRAERHRHASSPPEYADYNFCMGEGVNTPGEVRRRRSARLVDASARTGRTVGAYALFMVIADETDAAAQAKWELVQGRQGPRGAELDGHPGGRRRQGRPAVHRPAHDQPGLGGQLQYGHAGRLPRDRRGVCWTRWPTVPGVAGIMLTFDDFLLGHGPRSGSTGAARSCACRQHRPGRPRDGAPAYRVRPGAAPSLAGCRRTDPVRAIEGAERGRRDRCALSAIVRYPPGWATPAGDPGGIDEEFFVLDGALEHGGRPLRSPTATHSGPAAMTGKPSRHPGAPRCSRSSRPP